MLWGLARHLGLRCVCQLSAGAVAIPRVNAEAILAVAIAADYASAALLQKATVGGPLEKVSVES